MSDTITIKVPDIGDFQDVDIIEILVAPGDPVEPETSLITLETDKATMDIPCPSAGTVENLLVKVGDKVSMGDDILQLSVEATPESPEPAQPEAPAAQPATTEQASVTVTETPPQATDNESDLQAEVVVLGSGPGGYTAAFRAADLGKQVVLVERYTNIGGVCLNVGCIPSKALLHTAEIINEAEEMSAHGVSFSTPQIDLPKLASWKNKIIGKLTGGLAALAKQRKVKIVSGVGRITSSHTLEVTHGDNTAIIGF